MSVERLRAGYRDFAANEAAGRSPLYVELARGVAEDDELLAWLDRLPVGKRQPNLLFSAARVVGGELDGYEELRTLLSERRDDVEALLLARRTQTNEAARCATLLPLLAALPQPLALLEVGASAGLCLLPDRYAYEYDAGGATHRVGGGGPVLRCRVRGPAPLPASVPRVAWRAGLDLEPVDVADPEQVRWLEALVWPGEGDRLETLRAAIGVARQDPPRIVQGDLTTDLPALAAEAPRDATLVVFHTAVLAYVPREGRAAFRAAVQDVGATWIANEAPRVLGLDPASVPPSMFALARGGEPVAHTDSHGASLTWLA
ncbi:DUF2332 domain-containing protein [Candidatus Solirubrobacter pratensis]|uniref:DUF2332 domain-containing protein n=1 Tax=Candidatus Solirubrobacter pratensis TaxID=1298857 RepID=UPI00041801FD|nr:DUF2332 domain-containing protein [Candidatus Solirubrobacter pratensis]